MHASRPSSPSVHRLDCAQRRADPATCISEKETIRPRPRLQVPLRKPHGAFELKVVSIPRYSPESRPVTAPTMAAWPSPMNEGQTRPARLRTRASKEGDHRVPERAPGCARAASPCPCPCPPILSHRTFRAARALRPSDPAPFTSKSRVGDGRSGAPIRKADGWMYVDVRRPELMMFFVSRTIGYQCKCTSAVQGTGTGTGTSSSSCSTTVTLTALDAQITTPSQTYRAQEGA